MTAILSKPGLTKLKNALRRTEMERHLLALAKMYLTKS